MMDLDIPEALRRDANNVAPFMRTVVGVVYDCVCKRNGCPDASGRALCSSPEANLPATAPSWVPPWEAKS